MNGNEAGAYASEGLIMDESRGLYVTPWDGVHAKKTASGLVNHDGCKAHSHDATQVDRVVAYIRANPNCTTWDIQLNARTCKVSNRVNDARRKGYKITATRVGRSADGATIWKYRMEEDV